jgi:cysteine desulfurase family protein (TIGR01976 family)
MSNNLLQLDTTYIREQFPAFTHQLSNKWAFFENAGGSYVPYSVTTHLNHFMTSTKVQPYGEYDMSVEAGDAMDKATELMASLINCDKDEIIIGANTTMNLYVLSNAIKGIIEPGDEVIVTNQDHESNITTWKRIGCKVLEWRVNDNGELDINDLKLLLSNKTKIVAVTHCSNIIGSINDIKSIARLVHKHDAYIVVDGVAMAPHGFPDVKELDADFYTISLYKTYGPHLGLLYGKKELLKLLPNQSHECVGENVTLRLNPGGPNHEELASLVGIYEYFDELYYHHFDPMRLTYSHNITSRHKHERVTSLIQMHEQEIAQPLLTYLVSNPDVRLIGKETMKDRVPTISFIHSKYSSKDISKYLIEHGVACRHGSFYAPRILNALDINTEDGVVRISMVHYTTHTEVDCIIKHLEKFL